MMEGTDPTTWKIMDLKPDGEVTFDWHAIENFNASYELGVRGHAACDMARILWELRRQIADGLINGSSEVSSAILRGARLEGFSGKRH